MNKNLGFTLVELLIVITIAALLAAIALPSYQAYVLRNHASLAEARMLGLAQDLEQHKSRNFSYKAFTPISVTVGTPASYTINVVGVTTSTAGVETTASLAINGSGWVMKAIPTDVRNYTYLFNSQGLRCRNKVATNVTYTTCGGGSENW